MPCYLWLFLVHDGLLSYVLADCEADRVSAAQCLQWHVHACVHTLNLNLCLILIS